MPDYFDPNVWASQNQISITLDPNGQLVPDPGDARLRNKFGGKAPNWGVPNSTRALDSMSPSASSSPGIGTLSIAPGSGGESSHVNNDLTISPDLFNPVFSPANVSSVVSKNPLMPTGGSPNLPVDNIDQAMGLIFRLESQNKPFVGTGGQDLSNAPLDTHGFPIWEGVKDPKTGLVSHAAGLGQLQPGTWARYAKPGESFRNVDDQIAVAKRVFVAEGWRPWAPYNPAIARAIGWKGGEATTNPLTWGGGQLPSNGQVTTSNQSQIQPRSSIPGAVISGIPTNIGGLISNGPWGQLLALSALAQGFQHPPIKYGYNPNIARAEVPVPSMQGGGSFFPGLPSRPQIGGVDVGELLKPLSGAAGVPYTRPEAVAGVPMIVKTGLRSQYQV